MAQCRAHIGVPGIYFPNSWRRLSHPLPMLCDAAADSFPQAQLSIAYKFIIHAAESQNGRGWKGPLWVI